MRGKQKFQTYATERYSPLIIDSYTQATPQLFLQFQAALANACRDCMLLTCQITATVSELLQTLLELL